MLTLIVVLKALTEIAALALIGQAVLFILAGSGREQNVVYRLFKTITWPVWRTTRLLVPRFIGDAEIGFIAFFLIAAVWAGLTLIKIRLVLQSIPPP